MPIKVLHIVTSTIGGAGIAVSRIHHALLVQGVDSRMLVMEDSLHELEITVAEPTLHNRISIPNIPILRGYLRKWRKNGHFLTRLERLEWEQQQLISKYGAYVSVPMSSFDLEHHPLIEWADIVHIHWVQDFLNYESFFTTVKKPIVWTMHDQNPLFGGFHHERLRARFMDVYRHYEEQCLAIKRRGISKATNLTIVAISNEMHKLIADTPLYQRFPIVDIPNCIESELFSLTDKGTLRKGLQWSNDKRYLLFVNRKLNDTEKGLTVLVDVLNSINIPDIVLVCVGNGSVPESGIVPIIHIPAVDDLLSLSQYYGAADLLVMPSFQESFGNTAVEALYCGTPVVMNRVGIAGEIISEETGVIAENTTKEAWSIAISKALSISYNREHIRQIAVSKFSSQRVGGMYMQVYQKLLDNSR